MTRVFIHPLAGVLSAYGMGLADVRALRQQAVETRLDAEALLAVEPLYAGLEAAARGEIAAQGVTAERIDATRTLHLKYEGTDTTLEVPAGDVVAPIVAEFEARYARQYGFLMPGGPGDRGRRRRGGRHAPSPRGDERPRSRRARARLHRCASSACSRAARSAKRTSTPARTCGPAMRSTARP